MRKSTQIKEKPRKTKNRGFGDKVVIGLRFDISGLSPELRKMIKEEFWKDL